MKLHAAGCSGVRYRLRHDPGRSRGLALFGPEGAREDWSAGEELAIAAEVIERLSDECGIEVVEIPRAAQLRFLRPDE